jgi:phosphate-selective porin OprO and OprP
MGNKCSRRCRACGTLAAVCAAILPVVANAQDPAIDRIEAIERQIRGLQSELERLKSELGEAKQQLRQSRGEAQRAQEELRQAREAAERARQDTLKAAAAKPQTTQTAPQMQAAAPAAADGSAGAKVSMPEGRPTIATADGRLSLAIGGLVQFDMGGYFQHPKPNTQFPQLYDGVNLRRGRLYFVGKFDDFTVNVTPDFGGSPDGAPTLYEANINYTGFKPVTATVGYFHPLVSLSDATFPGYLLFLERASIINIERSVAADKQRASLGVNAAIEDYFASAYLTGPPFGAQRPTLLNGEQVGLVGRLASRPYHDEASGARRRRLRSTANVFCCVEGSGETVAGDQRFADRRRRPWRRFRDRALFGSGLGLDSHVTHSVGAFVLSGSEYRTRRRAGRCGRFPQDPRL